MIVGHAVKPISLVYVAKMCPRMSVIRCRYDEVWGFFVTLGHPPSAPRMTPQAMKVITAEDTPAVGTKPTTRRTARRHMAAFGGAPMRIVKRIRAMLTFASTRWR